MWLAVVLTLWLCATPANAFFLHGGGSPVVQVAEEEFVGPFASWLCAKSLASGSCGAAAGGYGTAAGNGSTDDTTALQTSLNALSASHPVLWIPDGTYKITGTLILGSAACNTASPAGLENISVIGQDSSGSGSTIITWAGSAGGTMMCLNGVAYSRFDRLVFNGASSASILVDQNWVGTGFFFDVGNEYTDDVFENATTGLRCGWSGFGCADTAMLRDTFSSLSGSGIVMGNANALGMFAWYSTFANNNAGLDNTHNGGNFSAYYSNFSNSAFADVDVGNPGTFTFRGNYSNASNIFFNSGANASPGEIVLIDNTILDATCSTCGGANLSVFNG